MTDMNNAPLENEEIVETPVTPADDAVVTDDAPAADAAGTDEADDEVEEAETPAVAGEEVKSDEAAV